MAGSKKLVLSNLEGLTLLLGLLTNHFQPVFPEGHCRVHCSVRDRSVQCIPNHLYPAFGSFHSQIPKSVEYFFSMMRSEHHTGMHSFHNILISKSALVFLEQLQGRTPFLISHCIHDADSSSLGSLFVLILCDLISNGGSTRHQRYWLGLRVAWWGGEMKHTWYPIWKAI